MMFRRQNAEDRGQKTEGRSLPASGGTEKQNRDRKGAAGWQHRANLGDRQTRRHAIWNTDIFRTQS